MVAASRTPIRPAAAGDRLGKKYVLARRIAVGGMGEIWIARNEMTDADVALKILRRDLERHNETEARFRHEARLGATLTHRNIVRVFDLLEEPDGTLLLVMELLRGVTLRRAIGVRSAPYSGQEAVAIILPILSALQHAHDRGVVHRDLKPANIVLAADPDGHLIPKLLDFGIAKIPDSSVRTMFGRVLGTPRYMSPEQIRAEPKIDGRSDVFSAAVLIIEMLTGASPFRAATPSASLAAVLEQDVDPDPRIDPQLWLALKRALAKRPYERYASAAEFGAALRQVVGKTDAELVGVLQAAVPPIASSGAPSFADLTPGFSNEPKPKDDEDEDDPEFEPEAPAASVERISTGSNRGVSQPVPRDDLSVSLPMDGPKRNGKWVAGVAVSAVLLAVAAIGITRSEKKPIATDRTSSGVASSTPAAAPDIPPPTPVDMDLDPQTTASATHPAPTHVTKASPAVGGKTKSRHDKPPEKAPDRTTGKKPVARTPDF